MKVACLLAAGLALASSATVVRANQNPTTNDVQALNYALQLEHLENQFYIKGLNQFQSASAFPAGVRDYITLIQAHEQAHVSILTNAITAPVANGGYGQSSASQACSAYSFTNTNFADVTAFLNTAITLEDVGVSAYVAALNHLTNTGVQQVAATIATIEARHAAFLRNAAGSASASPATNVPFPEAVNTARLPAEVLQVAGQFFTTCSYNLSANVPNVRPGGVAIPSSAANQASINSAQPSSATPASPAPTYTQDQFNADIAVLQYALTLEYLEADFYQTFANRFNSGQFAAVSTVNSVVNTNTGDSIVSNIDMIRAHEVAHVSALQNILASRGATVPQPGCYNWSSITTATQFLAVADVLENTGVSAYDGAANGITDTGLQQIAAAVAVVEARHAAYLNNLNGKNATNQDYMSGNLDQPLNSTQIVSAVQALPYITGSLTNCANNRANTGSSASFAFFNTGSSSSSSGSNNNGGGSSANSGSSASSASSSTANNNNNDNGSASFAVPAFATAILAFASALLF